MDWTDEAIEQLRALWAEGLPVAEIGRRMGGNKNMIVGKAHRLDLAKRRSPIKRDGAPIAARNEEIRRLLKAGRTQRGVATMMGVSRTTVYDVATATCQAGQRGIPKRASPVIRQFHAPPPPTFDAPPREWLQGRRLALSLPLEPGRDATPVTFHPPKPRECRFPMWGHSERPTHRYCCKPAHEGRVYCEHHRRIAYTTRAA